MTIQEVFPFATASLRNINNAPEVLEAIRENCGFEVRILSGEEEAIFDYYGALQAMEMDKGLLTDIGGGSTELVFYQDHAIQRATSLPMGSLNLYQQYVKNHLIAKKSELQQIQKEVRKNYRNCRLRKRSFPTCAPSAVLPVRQCRWCRLFPKRKRNSPSLITILPA